jgi:hypothetical protein
MPEEPRPISLARSPMIYRANIFIRLAGGGAGGEGGISGYARDVAGTRR